MGHATSDRRHSAPVGRDTRSHLSSRNGAFEHLTQITCIIATWGSAVYTSPPVRPSPSPPCPSKRAGGSFPLGKATSYPPVGGGGEERQPARKEYAQTAREKKQVMSKHTHTKQKATCLCCLLGPISQRHADVKAIYFFACIMDVYKATLFLHGAPTHTMREITRHY